MPRINQVSAVLGKRGTGKTTCIKNLIAAYKQAMPNQKVLIVDTLDHPSYKEIPTLTAPMLKRWITPSIYRIYDKDTDEVMKELSENVYNCLLIFEDASKYLRRQLTDEVRKFIFDSKQKNLDIIFLFHGFMAAPPELFRIIDSLVIFKCDSPEPRKNDLINYEDVKKAYDKVIANKNPYYNQTVKIY